MKKILILVFSNLKIDARVRRQIDLLKNDYQVTVCCFDAFDSTDYEIIKIKKTRLTFFRKAVSSIFLLLGVHEIAYHLLHQYKKYVPLLKKRDYDLIIANDIETLPLAFTIASRSTKIYFDAHEYAPRHFEDRLYWRIFFQRFNAYLCRKYIPRVHGMSTINSGLADAYKAEFGVKPLIITNASDYTPLLPKKREHYPIKLVHHGIFNLSRQPDLMIDLMKKLDDRFTLDLIYLLPESSSAKTRDYFEAFKIKAQKTGKIKILPALKSTEIISSIHEHYDMGIILVPPVNFNYENGLPNKLFDCIQARLGLAVGPLKEIAKITSQYDIGVVSEDFTALSMASALSKLSLSDINRFKENANRAAGEMNAGHNKSLLLKALKEIL
jgi:hypothetical protein